jgi:hypothetical protein
LRKASSDRDRTLATTASVALVRARILARPSTPDISRLLRQIQDFGSTGARSTRELYRVQANARRLPFRGAGAKQAARHFPTTFVLVEPPGAGAGLCRTNPPKSWPLRLAQMARRPPGVAHQGPRAAWAPSRQSRSRWVWNRTPCSGRPILEGGSLFGPGPRSAAPGPLRAGQDRNGWLTITGP